MRTLTKMSRELLSINGSARRGNSVAHREDFGRLSEGREKTYRTRRRMTQSAAIIVTNVTQKIVVSEMLNSATTAL